MTAQPGTVGTAPGQEASRLTATAIEYAKTRGIDPATLEALGVGSGTAFFPRRLQRKSEAVFFPYHLDDEVVSWKAAAFPEKDFISKTGGQLCFYNLDNVLSGPLDVIYITEGEWDAAALIEAGLPIDSVLSVPNGARERKEEADDEEDAPRGYGYVEDALGGGLGRAKRFVWCGDSDSAGYTLRADMVRLLGAARFWFVEWPEGTKDAGDLLRTDGPEAVRELVTKGALPWPVEGLYRLNDLPEPPPMTLWQPGFPEWEGKVRLAPGTLSVVTGHPGHGKTKLWLQVWFHVCRTYDVVACVASFETRPNPHQRRGLRSLHSGKLERDMTPDEMRKADEWINAHYLWISHPDQKPALDWLLDMAETAVIRHGAKVLQIDPWNRLESTKPPRESETDYIGRCLSELYVFAQDFGCHVQVLAHPAKMEGSRRNTPPYLEDIAGSKNWDNRCDQGFTVHRPKIFDGGQRKTEAVLYHRKARFEELGYPCKLSLDFDLTRDRYVSADYTSGGGTRA